MVIASENENFVLIERKHAWICASKKGHQLERYFIELPVIFDKFASGCIGILEPFYRSGRLVIIVTTKDIQSTILHAATRMLLPEIDHIWKPFPLVNLKVKSIGTLLR